MSDTIKTLESALADFLAEEAIASSIKALSAIELADKAQG
jgi:hypothetical protein